MKYLLGLTIFVIILMGLVTIGGLFYAYSLIDEVEQTLQDEPGMAVKPDETTESIKGESIYFSLPTERDS